MHYAASKAAVNLYYSICGAGAGKQQPIRVNAIAPGMMDTEMFHILRSDLEESSTGSTTGQPNLSIIPLGRIAQPEEIAAAAVFLAGDAAVYITGQTLNVCGGIRTELSWKRTYASRKNLHRSSHLPGSVLADAPK